MFARTVNLRMKPNSVAAFTQTMEQEVVPLLRKQKGFQDEITFVVPGGYRQSDPAGGARGSPTGD